MSKETLSKEGGRAWLEAVWAEEKVFQKKYLPRLKPSWRSCRYCLVERVPTFVPRPGQPGVWILESDHECGQAHNVAAYEPLVITAATFEGTGQEPVEPVRTIVFRIMASAGRVVISEQDYKKTFMELDMHSGQFSDMMGELERQTGCRLPYDMTLQLGHISRLVWRFWLQQGAWSSAS